MHPFHFTVFLLKEVNCAGFNKNTKYQINGIWVVLSYEYQKCTTKVFALELTLWSSNMWSFLICDPDRGGLPDYLNSVVLFHHAPIPNNLSVNTTTTTNMRSTAAVVIHLYIATIIWIRTNTLQMLCIINSHNRLLKQEFCHAETDTILGGQYTQLRIASA